MCEEGSEPGTLGAAGPRGINELTATDAKATDAKSSSQRPPT